jgi:hypothetical protein
LAALAIGGRSSEAASLLALAPLLFAPDNLVDSTIYGGST